MKNFYAFLTLLLIGNFGFAQITIAQQDFDTGTPAWNYTAFPTPYGTGSDDWEIVTTNSDPSGTTGGFWGIQDLDNSNGGGAFDHTLTFASIDISSYENVTIDFDFYTNGFDSSDYLEYEIFYGASGSEIGQGRVSLNKNTAAWTTISVNIPNTADSAYIVIIANQNGGADTAGLDNFIIKGDISSTCTAPTTQASAYNTTSLSATAATLNWTSGDGDEVLVIVKENSAVDTDPTNGTTYTGNSSFGSGTEIGTGNYVVFAGTSATSAAVTGLNPSTTYHVAVYEYNTLDTCYLTPALTGSFTTSAITTVQFATTSASVAENAGTYNLTIEIANEDIAATTFDVVLTSGDAADINGYTTQSETFPGSSNTDITVTITITDDAIIEGNEIFTFEIQNVSGGNSAAVGSNNTFDLTILDNDAPTSGTLYDADFSNDGDGFPAHSSSSPPAPAPASAGPFGLALNQWTLSYNTLPSTDGGGNTFEVSGGVLQSRDWGGQGIFTSQVINVSGVSSVDISATGLNVDANDGPFIYFYILDGGTRVETSITSSNGNPVNYSVIGLDVSSASTLEVGFEFSENGGGQGYDVYEFIVTAGCTAPSTQASAYNTTSLGTTSATLNWTSGNGDEVLVLIKEGSAVDADPSNGTSYTGNTVFGSGTEIGTGNYVVFAGTTTNSVSVTGLNPSTTYHIAVYEYNTTDSCYLIPGLTDNFTTDCSTPDAVSAFNLVADNSLVNLSWTNGSCYDEILVIAKANSAVTVTPTGDGTAYTANTTFGSGTDLGSGEYAVYKGTGTMASVTGLTNGTMYHFTVFTRKGTTWSIGTSGSATPNLVEEAVAGDLIITEVSGDGSASGNDNGYMEIYNRSSKIINLDNIQARYFNSNPGNSTQEVTLSGTLSPGNFIIVTQNGSSYTSEHADTADAIGTDFFFNGGDDGCDVYHTSNGIIDQFNDNGNGQSPWNWSDNFTYIRNSSESGAIEGNWTQHGTETPRSKPNLYFWTGNTDTSWTSAGNWDEGSAPISTTDVVITDQTNQPLISSSVQVSNLTIETNGNVVVEKTGNLEASGNLNHNGTLTLASDSDEYSSLIVQGAVTGSGISNYNRHVNGNSGLGDTNAIGNNDLISPPLSGQPFGLFSAANSNLLTNPGDATEKAFAIFDKTVGNYVNYFTTTNANTTLEAGVGYRAATNDTSTLTFTGTVNTGTVTNNILNSGPAFEEWNLIGNPYPSYLNVQDFLNYEVGTGVTNVDLFHPTTAAIYGYDGDVTGATGYTIYNLANTTPSTAIAPGQGFLVSADATNVSAYDVTFHPSMRTTGNSDDFIVGRTSDVIMNVELQISTASSAYVTDIYFNENATLGLDQGYDAAIFGGTAPSFAIYSHLVEGNTGTPFAIQALGKIDLANTTIALGVNANAGEQLRFVMSEFTLPDGVEVYLDDTLTNTATLLNSSDYIITPSTDLNGTGRFYLRVSNNSLSTSDKDSDQLSIYTDNANQSIVISGLLSEATKATIYDVQGRVVSTTLLQNIDRLQLIDVSHITPGVYVVQLANGTQNKTQKVILKQ